VGADGELTERRPEDVSVEARVADVVLAIEALDLAPVVLIGQSLGGVTALLVAAGRPELISRLVLADAGLAADHDTTVGEVIEGLATWPDPRFDLDVMERTLRATVGRSYWAEWEQIECPTLVARAEHGVVPPDEAEAMAARRPGIRLVEIPGAGHDLHLDSPAEWRAAISDFL
jgi:pimeloyl-ACP methyl ester carboxylesterase